MSMDKKTPPLRVFSIPYGGTARKCAMIERRKQEGWAWKKRGCTPCPRRCGANRTTGRGQCGMGARLRVARAALDTGEEPCLCGRARGRRGAFFRLRAALRVLPECGDQPARLWQGDRHGAAGRRSFCACRMRAPKRWT